MSRDTPPDSYFERPEPSLDDLMEEAKFEVDQLVEEWAVMARTDLGLHIYPNRYGNDVIFKLDYVESNGNKYEVNLEFDSIKDVREHVEKSWPIPDEYPDEMEGEQ